MNGAQTIYVCPGDGCRFHAMEPGKCRSHPYPCRAMGPELVRLDMVPAAVLEELVGAFDAWEDHFESERSTRLVQAIEDAREHLPERKDPA